jgi:hypothetical protein
MKVHMVVTPCQLFRITDCIELSSRERYQSLGGICASFESFIMVRLGSLVLTGMLFASATKTGRNILWTQSCGAIPGSRPHGLDPHH